MDRYLYTPQKAIAKLKQLLPDESQVTMGGRRNGKELVLAIHMGIKALEKQIAKVITRKDMSESFKCPNCNEDRSWKDGLCCKDCGQLLDWRNDYCNSITVDEFLEMKEVAIQALEKQLDDKWIAVSEKLPEYNEPVLLYLKNTEGEKIQVVGYLFFSENEHLKVGNDNFSIFDGGSMPDFLVKEYVKAWRPLPEPYEGE